MSKILFLTEGYTYKMKIYHQINLMIVFHLIWVKYYS